MMAAGAIVGDAQIMDDQKITSSAEDEISGTAKEEISEASLLEADDYWHAFFSAADKDDLAWLRHVVELLGKKKSADS